MYAVWQGRRTGVFERWEDAREQIDGFPAPGFAAYDSRDEAERALEERRRRLGPAGPAPDRGIAVDASCAGAVGPVAYRGVDLRTGRVVFDEGPVDAGTNHLGEMLAIVRGLELVVAGTAPGPVWSESEVALGWVAEGRHRSGVKPDDRNRDLRRRLCRAELWLIDGPEPPPVERWRSDAWGAIPVDFGRVVPS